MIIPINVDTSFPKIFVGTLVFLLFLILSLICVANKRKNGNNDKKKHVAGPNNESELSKRMKPEHRGTIPQANTSRVSPTSNNVQNKYTSVPKRELKNSYDTSRVIMVEPADPLRPSGLSNTHETCYMNSMIQAIASSRKLILQYEGMKKFGAKVEMLTKLLNGINSWGTKEGSVRENTSVLKDLMKSVKWDRPSEQDAYQLLSYLINGVQSDIKDHFSKDEKTLSPKLRILHSFSENPRYNKIQDHLGLAIPLCGEFRVRPGVNLKELLDAFFAPSEIDDGPNSTQLYLYDEAPDVMILHVQANEWSEEKGDYIKPVYHILYEEILEYNFIIQKEKDGSKPEKSRVKYKLVAVVHHMGGVQGGHYITYRMLGDHWFLTNDEQVEKVEFKCGVTPYIMVYEKVQQMTSV